MSKLHRWIRIPPEKSLFGARPGKGLPIGNLTSQFLANVYLNPLDQYVKHTLKARYCIRYVDDIVLVHEDRDTLEKWRERIEAFLRERGSLRLSPSAPLRAIPVGTCVAATPPGVLRFRLPVSAVVQARKPTTSVTCPTN